SSASARRAKVSRCTGPGLRPMTATTCSRSTIGAEHFPTTWIPVWRKKCEQMSKTRPCSDSSNRIMVSATRRGLVVLAAHLARRVDERVQIARVVDRAGGWHVVSDAREFLDAARGDGWRLEEGCHELIDCLVELRRRENIAHDAEFERALRVDHGL